MDPRGRRPAGSGSYIAGLVGGRCDGRLLFRLLYFDLGNGDFLFLGLDLGYGDGVLHGPGFNGRGVHSVGLGANDRLLHFVPTFSRLLASVERPHSSDCENERGLPHEASWIVFGTMIAK